MGGLGCVVTINRDAIENAANRSATMLPRIATMALAVTPAGLLMPIIYFFIDVLVAKIGSVRDAEPLAYVLRMLQLVEHGDGIVLERDGALSPVIYQ